MPKLKEIVLNATTDESGKVVYPNRALRINADFFSKMITSKTQSGAMNNGRLIEQISDTWSTHLKGSLEPKIDELYLDIGKLQMLDTEERIIKTMGVNEIMELEIDQIIASRAIAKINVHGHHDEFFPSIAVNLNEKGDEMAFGQNVQICSNFTIMGSSDIRSTYKSENRPDGRKYKLKQKDILSILENKMKETEYHFDLYMKQIDQWSKAIVTRSEFHKFLGVQFEKISVVNHHRIKRNLKALEETELAVNGVQLGRIAVEAFKPSYSIYEWEGDETTLWKLINHGTEILKFQNGSDSASVLQANKNWVQLINSYQFN